MTAIVLYLQHTPNARTRRSGSLSYVPFGLADGSAMERLVGVITMALSSSWSRQRAAAEQ